MAMYVVRAALVVLITSLAYSLSEPSYKFLGNSSREHSVMCSWSRELIGEEDVRYNYVLQFWYKHKFLYGCFFRSSMPYLGCKELDLTENNASYSFVDVMEETNVKHCCSGQELETFVVEFAKNCTVATNFHEIYAGTFNRSLWAMLTTMGEAWFEYYNNNFLTTTTTTEDPEQTNQPSTSKKIESNSAHGQFAWIFVLFCSLAALGYQAVDGH